MDWVNILISDNDSITPCNNIVIDVIIIVVLVFNYIAVNVIVAVAIKTIVININIIIVTVVINTIVISKHLNQQINEHSVTDYNNMLILKF